MWFYIDMFSKGLLGIYLILKMNFCLHPEMQCNMTIEEERKQNKAPEENNLERTNMARR